MKDGRPEPLIRQWYYSKIFHDLYTTKEAIALRKKIISWKCSGIIILGFLHNDKKKIFHIFIGGAL